MSKTTSKLPIQVWSKKAAEKADKEQRFLRLSKVGDKAIILKLVDREGKIIENGNLLSVDYYLKTIILFDNISDEFGLKTNFAGTPLTISKNEIKLWAEDHDCEECDEEESDKKGSKKTRTLVLRAKDLPKELNELIKKHILET